MKANFVHALSAVFLLFGLANCKGQNKENQPRQSHSPVGGGCDGCELIYTGMPSNITAVDTSAGWNEAGQKLLVTGKVYKADGTTPAPGIIVYYYHTDNTGHYSKRNDKPENQTAHGHIRGWVKTDSAGRYSIYTIRPAPYPGRDIPAHIHVVIKELNINEYYIDELVFDNDKLLTTQRRKALENRGGSGILRVLLNGNLQVAEHDIILGLHIPKYLVQEQPVKQSGLSIGEDQPSFTPFHAYGPDKGSRACPVCKYWRYQGIIYFAGNHYNQKTINEWLIFFEKESERRGRYLKVYFVYGNDGDFDKDKRMKELEDVGARLHLKQVALTFVPSFGDEESNVNLNHINPDAENTIILYRQGRIVGKFIDLLPDEQSFNTITGTLNKTRSVYIDLKVPHYD